MKRKFYNICLIILFIYTVNEARTTYNFNSDWKVFVGDVIGAEKKNFNYSKRKTVPITHPWNGDGTFSNDIDKLSTRIGWCNRFMKIL